MASSPDINAIFRRMDRKLGIQEQFGACLLCGKNFTRCNHTREQVQTLSDAWSLLNSLGRSREAGE